MKRTDKLDWLMIAIIMALVVFALSQRQSCDDQCTPPEWDDTQMDIEGLGGAAGGGNGGGYPSPR